MTPSHTTGPRRPRARRTPLALLIAAAVVALLAWAGTAAGQGVPGGPDLPPPDPTPVAPAPTPAPTPAPAPAPTPAPSTPAPQAQDSGPSPAEQAAQQAAAEQRARAAAEQRRRELARQRAEALARLRAARRERAQEFRAVTAYSQAQFAISNDLQTAVRALDGVAVEAAVAIPSDQGRVSNDATGPGSALLIVLLGASAISALLVLLSMLAGRIRSEEPYAANGGGRVQTYVAERMPFVAGHRVELAGVSVGCLVIAVLMQIGAI